MEQPRYVERREQDVERRERERSDARREVTTFRNEPCSWISPAEIRYHAQQARKQELGYLILD